MLYVDIPTLSELRNLAAVRAPICASRFLPTTPLTQETAADRITLKNLGQRVALQLHATDADKRQIAALEEHLTDLSEDDEFWRFQARSLAILATPDRLRTYRLPNRLTEAAEISDRFHLKPLLRAVTFPQHAYVLVLSQSAARLVEIYADHRVTVQVPGMPKAPRLQRTEGQKALLRQYARQIDHALRSLLAGRQTPLLLAAAEPLDSVFRSIASYPHLLAPSLPGVTEHATDSELEQTARAVLDGIYAREIEGLKASFEHHVGQGRGTLDVTDAARAATFGTIEALIVDMDQVLPGTVDESGGVALHDGPSADSYDVLDEIACRALVTGARVLSARRDDIPHGASLAAILRYAA
jgi:hypothetical protein